jgi:hypothetical protein
MRSAVILDAVRTPVGKLGGAYAAQSLACLGEVPAPAFSPPWRTNSGGAAVATGWPRPASAWAKAWRW